MELNLPLDRDVVAALAIGFTAATAIVHLVFAVGVFAEAGNARARGERILFAPPSIWALATLVAGPFAAAAFWFVHCSPRRARDQRDLVG